MVAVHPRARVVNWAREIAGNPETVYVDTETTGLDGAAEIVDIAVVRADGTVLLDTLVRPRRRIPAAASGIHGIYDAHVADAPEWTEVYELVLPLLLDRPVVIFNVAYDRRIIEQVCREHGLEAIEGADGWQCAMRAYAEYVGQRSQWGHGYRWHKLEKAAKAFGIPPGGHRACADAEACRRVVQGMAAGG